MKPSEIAFDMVVFYSKSRNAMRIYGLHLSSVKIGVKVSALEASNAERPAYNSMKVDDEFWFLFHFNQFDITWRKAEIWIKDN